MSKLLDNFLTVNQAAERMGVSTKTIRRWYEGGLLPAYRLNGRIRIKITDLDGMVKPL